MNAPNFDFGSQRNSGGLPASVSDDRRSLAQQPAQGVASPGAPYGDWEEEKSSGYRELFFKYLGLALKHRWILLAGAVAGLLVGFYVTLTATPMYRAAATIQIDMQAPKVVKLNSPDPDAADSRPAPLLSDAIRPAEEPVAGRASRHQSQSGR